MCAVNNMEVRSAPLFDYLSGLLPASNLSPLLSSVTMSILLNEHKFFSPFLVPIIHYKHRRLPLPFISCLFHFSPNCYPLLSLYTVLSEFVSFFSSDTNTEP